MNNFIISPERINDFACKRRYYYSHVRSLRLKGDTPEYFIDGAFFHEVMEYYYNDIKHSRKQGTEFYQGIARNIAAKTIGLSDERAEEIIKVITEYLNFYTEESWIIQEVELPFAVKLYETSDLTIIIRGKSDLLALSDYKNRIPIIVDHKLVKMNRSQVSRDNQKLTYCYVTGRRDFIINSVGKQKTLEDSKKFQRLFFNYTDDQIEEWKETTIKAVLEFINYAKNEIFPPNYHSCVNAFGRKCPFYDVCETSEDNREYKLESAYEVKEDYDIMGEEES